jgi:hypothetical protein
VSSKLAPYFALAAALCAALAGCSKIPGLHLPDEVFGFATLGAVLFTAMLGTTPGIRKIAPLVLLCVGLAFSACVHADPVIDVGVALDTAAPLAAATSKAMDAAVKSHRISPAAYAKWGAYLKDFQIGYDVAVAQWKAAKATANEPAEQKVGAALAAMVAQLGEFSALVLPGAQPTDGGAP